MALADDIILQRGQLLVTPGASGYGLYQVTGSEAMNFGTVALICELSDDFEVGQSVLFDIAKVKQRFAIGSTIYYQIEEKDTFLGETPAP